MQKRAATDSNHELVQNYSYCNSTCYLLQIVVQNE